MKILHTSDWHLGRKLYGQSRYAEFREFLDWLADLIEVEKVEILLIAGDIFDTKMPSNLAQELYYRFLCAVSLSCCRHIVIIAGNHDSPSFLDAPKELLRVLNVHVVGSVTDNPEDEVVVLKDASGDAEAVICAVPYLPDRDIRKVEAGESAEDKTAKLIQGVQRHYMDVARIAEDKQRESGAVPIIGMGHLFTAGGRTIVGDGVRELYVGTLAHMNRNGFPSCFDYLALGHLHVPQRVGGADHIRYSGSPIAMGFGEARQDKKVMVLEFAQRDVTIAEILVPCFQPLVRISGDVSEILKHVDGLKEQQSTAWLEIEYTGKEVVSDLQAIFNEAIAGSSLEIRRVHNKRIIERIINKKCADETLDDLDSMDVFNRCLDSHEVPHGDRAMLITSYQEIMNSLAEDDGNAE